MNHRYGNFDRWTDACRCFLGILQDIGPEKRIDPIGIAIGLVGRLYLAVDLVDQFRMRGVINISKPMMEEGYWTGRNYGDPSIDEPLQATA
jgi:hypothetical protein